MKKKKNKILSGILLFCLLLTCTACEEKKEPVHISVWNYYNGAQLIAFNNLVDEFNTTVGREKNIIVESSSIGNINDLTNAIYDAVDEKIGAQELPDIFAAYASTAAVLNQKGLVADLASYLTKDEKDAYIESYLQEGDLNGNGSLFIFPVAKSTEILLLNETDWLPFAEATGAAYDDLTTFEGITATAEKYYNWTDSLTEKAYDGKAFFGRDAMANYFYLGCAQLGNELIQRQGSELIVCLDEQIMQKLWDNYYVPMVKGYFDATGAFRSDGVKTGNLLMYLGSSSSASFFPKEVISDDNSSYSIKVKALPCPHFVGGENYAIQQGAGMAVINKTEKQVEAAVTFLKWFTEQENNIQFSVASGYLPVMKEANDTATICEIHGAVDETMQEILTASIDTVNKNTMYTALTMEQSENIRKILENTLSEKAKEDRTIVVQNLQAGMSLEKAAEEFLTQECFQEWYQGLLAEIEAII